MQQPHVLVLVSHPLNSLAGWRHTDIVRQASRLPRATVVFDPNGNETGRFGATASGTVMLFEPSGRRAFAGGVTASRGHEGGNAGIDALAALLAQERMPSTASLPVFGCRLCTPDEATIATRTGNKRLSAPN
jgi:hypothetical protein